MKDLIKEIEGLKVEERPNEDDYHYGFREDKNLTLIDVKHILNRHNIITAPKSIKLSEIIDRLNEELGVIYKLPDGRKIIGYEFKIDRNCTYIDGKFESLLSTCVNAYHYGKKTMCAFKLDVKNNFIEISFEDKFKWLYALWIAGTEIIDDMEE